MRWILIFIATVFCQGAWAGPPRETILTSPSALEVLGVDSLNDPAALKTAYRGLIKLWHPDRHSGDKAAEEVMKRINIAYDQLLAGETKMPEVTSGSRRADRPSSSPPKDLWTRVREDITAPKNLADRIRMREKFLPLVREPFDFIRIVRPEGAIHSPTYKTMLDEFALKQMGVFFSKKPSIDDIKDFERALLSDSVRARAVRWGMFRASKIDDIFELAKPAFIDPGKSYRSMIADALSAKTTVDRFFELKPTLAQAVRLEELKATLRGESCRDVAKKAIEALLRKKSSSP